MDGEHSHGDLEDQINLLENRFECLEGEVPPNLDNTVSDLLQRIADLEQKMMSGSSES